MSFLVKKLHCENQLHKLNISGDMYGEDLQLGFWETPFHLGLHSNKDDLKDDYEKQIRSILHQYGTVLLLERRN